MPLKTATMQTIFKENMNNSTNEQHQLILDTLAIYDANTISIEEAISIVRTFAKTENQYCKAIYRFMQDQGFEQQAVESIIELHLQYAIANGYSESQIQIQFSVLANLVMALLASSEENPKHLNEQQKQTVLFALKNYRFENVNLS